MLGLSSKNNSKTAKNWCIDIKIAPNLWYNKITTSNKPCKKRC
jgi:hypothetical protein